MAFEDRAYNRDEGGGIPPVQFSLPKLSRLTIALMVSCLVIFLVQAFTRSAGSPLERWGVLTFAGGLGFVQPWRWVTYQYLHGGGLHLFFNMIGVFFFLPALEAVWGWKKTLAFYTLGGTAGGLLFMAFVLMSGRPAYLLGASGSVLALLGACALLFPERQLILLIFPVPIRMAAALIGGLYLLTSVADQNLSDAAHLGGLAFGWFAPLFGGPFVRRQQRRWERYRDDRAHRLEVEEQATVDRILAKVHQNGMNSLSRGERRALKQATERQRVRDAARARRRAS
jgi:membrane associated rhomboid family serine protease